MSSTVFILGAVFFGVTLLVVAVAMLLRDRSVAEMEDRLSTLTKGDRGGDGSSLSGLSQFLADQRGDNKGLIEREFGRVFEEQNLGIPFEEALVSLTARVPNLDLKFFATAIVLQRQTGGDLAEILDKIGTLVRERFKIWGQVQALTGEGRLSGIVLLALPPMLFIAVYRMNPDYVM